MTDMPQCAPWPRRIADIVTGVNSVAVSTPGKAPGTRLLKAGVIAFLAVVVSWVIYAVISGHNGALDEVDLTVYRDGGLIVRHVRPYYDPHAGAPLYDWGGYSALALKFTYTPFAAISFAVISFLPWTPLWILSVVVNIAALVAALWFTFGGLGYTRPPGPAGRDADRRGGHVLAAAGRPHDLPGAGQPHPDGGDHLGPVPA